MAVIAAVVEKDEGHARTAPRVGDSVAFIGCYDNHTTP
jgi:hypothetical protein